MCMQNRQQVLEQKNEYFTEDQVLQYMIEEQAQQLEQQTKQLEQQMKLLDVQAKQLDVQARKLAQMRKQISESAFQIYISTCQDLGLTREETLSKLIIKYCLSAELAEEKMSQYW